MVPECRRTNWTVVVQTGHSPKENGIHHVHLDISIILHIVTEKSPFIIAIPPRGAGSDIPSGALEFIPS